MNIEEIREYCLMSISDKEPEEAAEILLKYQLEDQLTAGQIKQISHEMQTDKMSVCGLS